MKLMLVHRGKFLVEESGVGSVKVNGKTVIPFDGRNPEAKRLCKLISKQLKSRPCFLDIDLLPVSKANGGLLGVLPCKLTDFLVDCFQGQVTFDIKIELEPSDSLPCSVTFKSKQMPVRKRQVYACEDNGFPHGEADVNTALEEGKCLSGAITVVATLGEEPDVQSNVGVSDQMEMVKKMLHDHVAYDFMIIPNYGNPVKCHKSFLAAHSEVFGDMFRKDKPEPTPPQTLEIPEMSEEGVEALLAFLYYWDQTAPKMKASVAFELLTAGRKYKIPKLELAMRKLMVSRQDKWYDVDTAMNLFLLARNLSEEGGDSDQLKRKAIKILKKNFISLERSPTYNELFKNNPEAAKELCKYFAE